MTLKLIVGLQNPGPDYEKTRHNAGAWFIASLLAQYPGPSKLDKSFQGVVTPIQIDTQPCTTFTPTTFMNQSGLAVRRIAQFYNIPVEQILIIHDDLDLPVGTVRLKTGGGHGGHNGLRDLIQQLGQDGFHRLRIGIGHPGHRDQVHDYVLGKPSISDKNNIMLAIENALSIMPLAIRGEWAQAMQHLHTPS